MASVFGCSINKCYITEMDGLHSTAGWPCEKKGYELRVLNWITRRIYFFHPKFLSNSICYINVINVFNHNCKILQQNWLYIIRKKPFHQQWQQNNVNFSITINTFSFPNNWKWEMLYEEQNIQWKHCISVLKLLIVSNTT